MPVLGWLVAAGSLLVLLPVLPFLAVVRLYDALRGGQTEAETRGWPTAERRSAGGSDGGLTVDRRRQRRRTTADFLEIREILRVDGV